RLRSVGRLADQRSRGTMTMTSATHEIRSKLAGLAVAVMALGYAGPSQASRYVFVGAREQGVGGVEGLRSPEGVTISPDGAYAYVAGALDTSIVIFARNPSSGALTFVEAAAASALTHPGSLVVSADGAHLYATAETSVGVFSRNAGTGQLSFVEAQD